jgi:[NiFe] hydrogenase diaphorase moiety large subunit
MNEIDRFIGELLADSNRRKDQLLPLLLAIQARYSHIPERALQALSGHLDMPVSEIVAVIYFYAFLSMHDRGDFDIRFSDNITDRMLGNRALIDSMCSKLNVETGVTRADGKVCIDLTSCTGLCDQGPALLVNGHAVPGLNEDRIHKMVGLIEAGLPVSKWPKHFFEIKDNIQRRDILLNNKIIPGSAIESMFVKGADAQLAWLEQSGLRGCGGAGFKTASKWRFCRDTRADAHYVVCNADEGEPGTFKDRVLLNSYAGCMFEGMTLCAGIIGAHKGFLYLRGEYQYLRESLEKTLQARRSNGLLGESILGHAGFDFDIEIRMGAGAYVCGEESALIESLEGKRGIPRNRPPFPANCGFLGQPTVVNNVETFVASSRIAVFGPDWFNAIGTDQSKGTKLLSISGDCERPGIYEYPYGTSIREILHDCGARDTQAVQLSGAAGMTVPPEEFYRKIAFEDAPTGGSFMVFNQQRDLLEMVDNFIHFFCHESCGFCTPCRIGGMQLKDLVNKVMVGHATSYDTNEMKRIGRVMQATAHCGLGATTPNPVLDTLGKFPGIYSRRLLNRSYEPAFDLDAALEVSRKMTGRDDEAAHIRYER